MSIGSGSGSHREVTITTRIQVDRQSAQTALRETVKAVAAQQKAADKAAKESAREQAKAVREAERAKLKELRDTNKRTIAILKQQERDAVAAEKAKQRAVAETNKRTIAGLKQQEREAKLAETAAKKAHAVYESSQARLASANDRVVESFKQSLSGAMSLGRGLAMIGLVGEEDTQKLLRGLIKVQAAFDVMRGSIEVIHAMVRGWRAYRDAVAAAAVAQSALGTAQSATLAGGAALAGGGFLKLLGGAATKAAPFALVGAAGYAAYRGIAGMSARAESAREQAARAQWQTDIRGLSGGVVQSPYAALHDAQQQSAWLLAQREAETAAHARGLSGLRFDKSVNEDLRKRAWADYAAAKRRRDELWGTAMSPGPMQRIRVAATWENRDPQDPANWRDPMYVGRVAAATAGIDVGKVKQDYLESGQQMQAALERIYELESRRLQINRDISRTAIQGAETTLRILQQQLAAEKERIQAARDATLSAKVRFGMSTPLEQRRYLSLAGKVQAGGQLTREEAGFFRGLGTMETERVYTETGERLAELGG